MGPFWAHRGVTMQLTCKKTADVIVKYPDYVFCTLHNNLSRDFGLTMYGCLSSMWVTPDRFDLWYIVCTVRRTYGTSYVRRTTYRTSDVPLLDSRLRR